MAHTIHTKYRPDAIALVLEYVQSIKDPERFGNPIKHMTELACEGISDAMVNEIDEEILDFCAAAGVPVTEVNMCDSCDQFMIDDPASEYCAVCQRHRAEQLKKEELQAA